jgi:hypothetical protein
MIAVIFEFTPAPGRFSEYMDLVGERFESITTKGKFVSLQFWRDEEAVLRIAEVMRDYTMDERTQAPADSLVFHTKVHG